MRLLSFCVKGDKHPVAEIIVIRATDRMAVCSRPSWTSRGRRAEVIEMTAPSHDILTFGDIEIHPDRRTVLKAGEEVRLNHGEFSHAPAPGPVLLGRCSARISSMTPPGMRIPLWDHRGREYHLAAAAEVRGRSQAPGLHQDGHPKRI